MTADQSKAVPIAGATASMSPVYTLPVLGTWNKRRLPTTRTSSTANAFDTPIGDEMDFRRLATWYRDPYTGRITDSSNDNQDGNSYTQAQDALPTDQPIVRNQDEAPFYPILYSCEHVLQNVEIGGSTTASMENDLTIPMTVEALLPSSMDDIGGNIQALQWSFLNAIANRCGLINTCNLQLQYENDGMVRHQRQVRSNSHFRQRRASDSRDLQVSNLSYPTTIYLIASDPLTDWRAQCTKSNGFDAASYKCYSIRLFINIKYRGSDSESNQVQKYVQSIVRNQVQIDPKQLFVDNISGLHWLEDSHNIFETEGPEVPENSSTGGVPKNDTAGSQQDQKSGNTIGFSSPEIIIPIATVIFLFFFWLVVHSWNRSNKKRQEAFKATPTHQASHQDGDIESGSFRTERMSVISPTNSSSNPVDVDEISLHDKLPQPEPICPEKASNETTVAGLPPRPPGIPRIASLKLKKRRKKKKLKKKVVALQRVSSRENIDVMPTVSESEDEESEIGSEGDTEYGSDDDGSSYDASSGCLTPSRTKSRTSSRASSPQQSPQDESLPSGFFNSGIEFVIETSDFPNLLDMDDQEDERDKNIEVVEHPPRIHARTHQEDDIGLDIAMVEKRAFEIEPAPNSDLNKSSGSEEGTRTLKSMLPLPWLP